MRLSSIAKDSDNEVACSLPGQTYYNVKILLGIPDNLKSSCKVKHYYILAFYFNCNAKNKTPAANNVRQSATIINKGFGVVSLSSQMSSVLFG
jgi:hypothetical protein